MWRESTGAPAGGCPQSLMGGCDTAVTPACTNAYGRPCLMTSHCNQSTDVEAAVFDHASGFRGQAAGAWLIRLFPCTGNMKASDALACRNSLSREWDIRLAGSMPAWRISCARRRNHRRAEVGLIVSRIRWHSSQSWLVPPRPEPAQPLRSRRPPPSRRAPPLHLCARCSGRRGSRCDHAPSG